MGDRTARTVGVIGLGRMGLPICAHLVGAGFEVVVHDPVETHVDAARGHGASAAGTASEVGRRAEVVLLSLPTPEVVVAVVDQLTGGGACRLVLDTSTNGPATARQAFRALAAHGISYADTPVLGRPESVGRWTIPVGGSAEAFREATPVLQHLATSVVHAGDVGSAATVKVANNMMLSAINAVTAEALALVTAAGIDPERFVEIVVDSGAASVSGLFREVAPRAARGDVDARTFSVRLMHKDTALALVLAEEHGLRLYVTDAAQRLNDRAVAAGLGDLESIAVINVVGPDHGDRGGADV